MSRQLVITALLVIIPSATFARLSTYSLECHLNEKERVLICTENIIITNTFKEPISTAYFRLANHRSEPNPKIPPLANDAGYIDGYQPDAVEIDWASIPFHYQDEANFLKIQRFSTQKCLVQFDLPSPLKPGASTTITMRFKLKFPNVYSNLWAGDEKWFYNDTYILRLGWYPLEVARDDSRWLLEKNVPAYHTMSQISLSLPKKYIMAKPSITPTQAIVSMPLAFSPHFKIITTNALSVFYLPQTTDEQARKIVGWTKESVEFYSEKYGKPGFEKAVIVNAPFSGLWGMAANGFALLGDGCFSTSQVLLPYYTDRVNFHIVSHEVGHWWAGIGTPVDFNETNVFSEGLTEYLSYNFFEEKYGKESNLYEPKSAGVGTYCLSLFAENSLFGPSFTARDSTYSGYFSLLKNKWDEPAILKTEYSHTHALVEKIYNKGELLFHNLENYVGQSAMQSGLRDYFQSHHNFQSSLQAHTDKPLASFFDAWFYRAETVDFAIKKLDFNRVSVSKNGVAPTNLDVEITDSMGRTERKTIQDAQDGSVATFNSYIKEVRLDPNYKIPESNKMNNKSGENLDFYLFGDQDALLRKRPFENYFLGIYPTEIVGKSYQNHRWSLGYDLYPFQWTGGITLYGDREKTLSYGTNFSAHSLTAALPIYWPVDVGYFGHFYYPEWSLNGGVTFYPSYTGVFAGIDYLSLNSLLFATSKLEHLQGRFISSATGYLPVKAGSTVVLPSLKLSSEKNAIGSLGVLFPLQFGLNQPIFGAGLFRGAAAHIFVNSDKTAGIEIGLLATTLADLKIPLTIGYDGRFYFTLNSPLTIYNYIFGY